MATLNFGDHLTNLLELIGTIKRTFQTVKVMFITHEDDSQGRFLAQHRSTQLRCCDVVSNGYNIIPTLQVRCVELKIIVTNRPV